MLMNIEPTIPTTKNPPEQFAGDVWLDRSHYTPARSRPADGGRDRPLRPGRPHRRGQYLRIISGIGRFGTRDGKHP